MSYAGRAPKTFVCFPCRKTARKGFMQNAPEPHCPGCGFKMVKLYGRAPSPTAKRGKLWDEFEAGVVAGYHETLEMGVVPNWINTGCAPASIRSI